jgi:DNA-binding response OmpR family regulator
MSARNVLVIDDERLFCGLAKMNLEMSGRYKVSVAFNGKDGIKIARKFKPDVILLDIMMPKMDGFEVLQQLKQDSKTMAIPVIMLSAKSEDKAKIKASEMDSAYYITKPIEAKELMEKIEWVLGLSGK